MEHSKHKRRLAKRKHAQQKNKGNMLYQDLLDLTMEMHIRQLTMKLMKLPRYKRKANNRRKALRMKRRLQRLVIKSKRRPKKKKLTGFDAWNPLTLRHFCMKILLSLVLYMIYGESSEYLVIIIMIFLIINVILTVALK